MALTDNLMAFSCFNILLEWKKSWTLSQISFPTIGQHTLKKWALKLPYFFPHIMDELTAHVQEKIPWCMLFANDIVLVNESRDGVNAKFER